MYKPQAPQGSGTCILGAQRGSHIDTFGRKCVSYRKCDLDPEKTKVQTFWAEGSGE